MKLYNTLTRNSDELKPLSPPVVTVYTCGPTVYDYAHIGHWFTYVRWDILVRTLKASGYQPKWVMNITDVGHLVSDADDGEDKLEKGARREGKTAWEVAKFYTDDFVDGMKALGMLMPDEMPRATDHIAEQIDLIQKLEQKGMTYTISDGVYYDTAQFPTYASFAKLDLEEQQEGARVEVNPEKRNASDFALWKFSPKDQKRDMEWDSPWGKGFPGWHIECSAMSMKYLGDTLDIHTGGIDHVPVHHTNEIAQSEAVTGKPFANIWLHSNHVMVDGEKISKSLGNGIRWQQLAEKGYDPLVLRLHVLESHYRSQSKFSWESLAASKSSLKSIKNNFNWIYQSRISSGEAIPALSGIFEDYKKQIVEALSDDLDTPKAIALLHKFAGDFSTMPASSFDIPVVEDFAGFITDTLGIKILYELNLTNEQKRLTEEREKARLTNDWKKSDEIRDQLAAEGIYVSDKPEGSIWYRRD